MSFDVYTVRDEADFLVIRRLFVTPEQRGRGLGRRLLSQAHARAQDGGITWIVLNTLPTMTSARKLYDADGYTPIEPYTDDPVDGVQYLGLTLNHTTDYAANFAADYPADYPAGGCG